MSFFSIWITTAILMNNRRKGALIRRIIGETYADICNTLGVECFIQKPIENGELVGRVKNMLTLT